MLRTDSTQMGDIKAEHMAEVGIAWESKYNMYTTREKGGQWPVVLS